MADGDASTLLCTASEADPQGLPDDVALCADSFVKKAVTGASEMEGRR